MPGGACVDLPTKVSLDGAARHYSSTTMLRKVDKPTDRRGNFSDSPWDPDHPDSSRKRQGGVASLSAREMRM